MTSQPPYQKKPLTSSILLWMRTDQPREHGMRRWKGPHAGIISATPGLDEYRQIHLDEANPGRWPETQGVETSIPTERKVDGVAEVTFGSVADPLRGRTQTALAYEDEVNLFRRTLLYAGPPGTSRWYEFGDNAAPVGARALVYLRRRDGVRGRVFREFIANALVPGLADTGSLRELRTQTFLPWSKRLWNSPSVAHDNPADQRFHASLILGFSDDAARSEYFESPAVQAVAASVADLASAVHAYDVSETLTFVEGGRIIPSAK